MEKDIRNFTQIFILPLSLLFLWQLSYGGGQLTKVQQDLPWTIREIEPLQFELRSVRKLKKSDIQQLIKMRSKFIAEKDGFQIQVSEIIWLDFSGSHLGDSAACLLFREPLDSNHLTQLILTNCDLQTPFAKVFAQILEKNQILSWVDLSCNQIDMDGAVSLVLAVLSNAKTALEGLNFEKSQLTLNFKRKKIQALTLSRNQLQDFEEKELQDAFLMKDKVSIEKNGSDGLSVTDTNAEGIHALAPLLKKSECLGLKFSKIENDQSNLVLILIREILIERFDNYQNPFKQLDLSHFGKVDANELHTLVYTIHQWAPICCLNLTAMEIGKKDRLRNLVESLKIYPQIKELTLDQNQIQDEGATLLAELLKEDNTLKKLSLVQNKIGNSGSIDLARALKSNASLQCLNLSQNTIGDIGVQQWIEFFNEISFSLEQLNLSFNEIGESEIDQLKSYSGKTLVSFETQKGDQVIEQVFKGNLTLCGRQSQIGNQRAILIAKALQNHLQVTNLDLTDNQIGDLGAQALAEVLKENLSIQELYLKENLIGDGGAEALASLLEHSSSLIHLNLKGNQIGDSGVIALAIALGKNQKLVTLNLGRNQIEDFGVVALARALEMNKSLTKLNLSQNQIGALLEKALSEKPNRKFLEEYVASYQIGAIGVGALAAALKKNKTLCALKLGQNLIGDLGVAALAKALKKNTTLEHLCLNENQIGDLGISILAPILGENAALENLHLKHNLIGDLGAKALAMVLEKNSTLLSLNLKGNRIGVDGVTAFVEAACDVSVSLFKINLCCNLIGKMSMDQVRPCNCLNTLIFYDSQEVKEIVLLEYKEKFKDLDNSHLLLKVKAFAKAINGEFFNFTKNHHPIKSSEFRSFLHMLEKRQDLMSIYLHKIPIGDHEAAILSKVLKKNRFLKHLTLNFNVIGDKGIEFIVCGLKENTTLKYLNLSRNSFKKQGVEALSGLLKKNQSLEYLNLGCNFIEDQGAEMIAKTIEENTSLKYLGIHRNEIKDEGVKFLEKGFEKNTSLKILNLWTEVIVRKKNASSCKYSLLQY